MRKWYFYDASGRFNGSSLSARSLGANKPIDLAAFDVTDIPDFDWRTSRVENGALVPCEPDAAPSDSPWNAIREHRDRALAASDWIVTRATERGESIPTPWLVYRQALRDITQQSDPAAIVWPAKP